VTALVQHDEPLDERQCEQHLAGGPWQDSGLHRQRDACPGRQTDRADRQCAGEVRWPKMLQLRWPWSDHGRRPDSGRRSLGEGVHDPSFFHSG
jgi:hypothetical protein